MVKIIKDKGPEPFVVDVERDTVNNTDFIRARWTGKNLQMTLMSLKPGQDIGLEIHKDHDQFLRIEQGEALVLMGKDKEALDFTEEACDDFGIFIPAGYWHNVINTGEEDLKMYSIYSPPEHDKGVIKTEWSKDVIKNFSGISEAKGRKGSYLEQGRRPKVGDEVWFLKGQIKQVPKRGVITSIEQIFYGNEYGVSIDSEGKSYRTSSASIYDHKPKKVEITDEFGTTKVWQ